MTTNADIVIVGAGAAGIAAARRLALSAMVLEATGRIGGRAWTSDVAGLHLDLGCGWLHSADRNPWTRVAEAAGFAIDRRAPAWVGSIATWASRRRNRPQPRRPSPIGDGVS